jgi:hypothetical protein
MIHRARLPPSCGTIIFNRKLTWLPCLLPQAVKERNYEESQIRVFKGLVLE